MKQSSDNRQTKIGNRQILLRVQKTGSVTSGWCRKSFGATYNTAYLDHDVAAAGEAARVTARVTARVRTRVVGGASAWVIAALGLVHPYLRVSRISVH